MKQLYNDISKIHKLPKEAIYDKTYVATIEFENPVDEKKLHESTDKFKNLTISWPETA